MGKASCLVPSDPVSFLYNSTADYTTRLGQSSDPIVCERYQIKVREFALEVTCSCPLCSLWVSGNCSGL